MFSRLLSVTLFVLVFGFVLTGGGSSAQHAKLTDNLAVITPENAAQIVEVQTIKADAVVQWLTWSPDQKSLAAVTTNDVQIYALDRGEISMRRIQVPTYNLVFSPDLSRIAAIVSDKDQASHIELFDTVSGKRLLSFGADSDGISNLIFSPDGKTLASSTFNDDKSIILWDAQTGGEVGQLVGSGGDITSFAFSPDGQYFASASSYEINVRLWDIKTETEIAEFNGPYNTITSVEFSPDGRFLASSSVDHEVYVWDVQKLNQVFEVRARTDLVSAGFSADSKMLVVSDVWMDGKGIVSFYDLASSQSKFDLKGHSAEYAYGSFAPNGETIVTTSFGVDDDSKLRFWNAETGQPVYTIDTKHPKVRDVAFNPQGALISSTDNTGLIQLWGIPQ